MIRTFAILKDHNFSMYAGAQFLSAIGNGMQFIAMSWLLFGLTGSVSSMGWFLVITTLPSILIAPWLGVLADRWSAKSVCMSMDVMQGFILLCLATAVLRGAVPVYMIYITELLVVSCASFYQPSSSILVKSVVPVSKLLAANSVRSLSVQIGVLFGAACGGLLISRYGTGCVIMINVMSFFVSAALTFFIVQVKQPTVENSRKRKVNIVRESIDAIQYMRSKPRLLFLMMMQAAVCLTLSTCNTLLPAFAKKTLSVGASGFGLIDSSWAFGAIISAPLLTILIRKATLRKFMIISLVCLSGSLALFLTAWGLSQAMVAYFLIGFMVCTIRVNTDSEIQANVSDGLLGRVTGTINMLTTALGIAVFCGVGYLGDVVPIRWIYATIALIVLAGSFAPVFLMGTKKNRAGLLFSNE